MNSAGRDIAQWLPEAIRHEAGYAAASDYPVVELRHQTNRSEFCPYQDPRKDSYITLVYHYCLFSRQHTLSFRRVKARSYSFPAICEALSRFLVLDNFLIFF